MDKPDSNVTSRRTITEISVSELKQLLTLVSENPDTVCIRYRMLGEMWQPNFLRVVQLTEKGIHLQDPTADRRIYVHDLSVIMQFELDGSLQTFQPNFHYGVVAG